MVRLHATAHCFEIPEDAYDYIIYSPLHEELALPWDADIHGDGKGLITINGLPLPGGPGSSRTSCVAKMPYDYFNKNVEIMLDTDDEDILSMCKSAGWEY